MAFFFTLASSISFSSLSLICVWDGKIEGKRKDDETVVDWNWTNSNSKILLYSPKNQHNSVKIEFNLNKDKDQQKLANDKITLSHIVADSAISTKLQACFSLQTLFID